MTQRATVCPAKTANRRRQILSTGGLLVERFLGAGLNLFVGIYVARYLGPSGFGLFNYVISIVTLAAAVAPLGVNGLLVRELATRPEERSEDLGTAFWLMAAGAFVSAGVVTGLSFASTPAGPDGTIYLLLAVTLVLVQPFTVIDLFCLSQVRAAGPAACRVMVMAFGATLKVLAIREGAPLVVFFVIAAVEQAILILSYLVVARLVRIPPFLRYFSALRAREMLWSSWPILVTAVAVAVHVRIGQILVTVLTTPEEAGLFAAATRIYEAWVYVPYLCAVSLAPALIEALKTSVPAFERLFERLTRTLFWTSAGLFGIVLAIGAPLVALTFGPQYLGAQPVLSVLMAAAAVGALGNCQSQYFIIYYRERAVARRTIVAAGLNVACALVLIPIHGAVGAALSVLLATVVANYGILWLFPNDRPLLASLHRAVLFLPRRGEDH